MASRLIAADQAARADVSVWRGSNPSVVPAPSPPRPAPEPAVDASPHAAAIVAQQARIQELERELDAKVKQAYQLGNNEGQAAGVRQAGTRLDPLMAKLAQTLQDLAGVRRRRLLEAEEDAVRLAVAVARRVLRRELTVDPAALAGIVKAACERVDPRDILRVRMHPEDVSILELRLDNSAMPQRVELTADAALERGAVVVDTERGSLDASVHSQLLEIERGLVDLVRRS